MAPSGKERHASSKRQFILDLWQDSAADCDYGVGGENQRFGVFGGDGHGLRLRKTQCMLARELALGDALVNVGRVDTVRSDADPGKQVEAPRTRRSEDQPHERNSARITGRASSAGHEAIGDAALR